MPVFTDLQLKQWFETGDFPNQEQFFNLIDSKVNKLDLASLLGLTIGSTLVFGGADKNIFFQQGSTVSQDNEFKYDYTNQRVAIGLLTPLSRLHVFSSVGNTDANPLTFTYQRAAGVINSNTTWFAHNATNGAGLRVGAFAFAQQAAGQGTRFSVLVTNDSAAIAATEALRLSQERRLSVGGTILNGATVDISSESNLSTVKDLRVRNLTNTADKFQILGDNSLIGSGSMSFDAKQTHTAGATVTINGNVRVLNVNPAGVIAGLVITLPTTASIKDGQEVLIVYGGTIGSGNVLTGLTIVANAGQTLLSTAATGTMKAGECHAFKWIASLNTWFNIKG
jgi:hypothetical protein